VSLYNNTVTLSDGSNPQSVSGLAPFVLTIDPSSITKTYKVNKIVYDYGDGTTETQKLVLNTNTGISPTSIQKTHSYYLTDTFQKTITVNVDFYTIDSTSRNSRYTINLNLSAAPFETQDGTYSLSANAFFSRSHLVGSRMFGPNNDILYLFETVNPKYILPVIINWTLDPTTIISKTNSKTQTSNLPFKLLSPFENANITNIAKNITITHDGYTPYSPNTTKDNAY